MLKLSPSHAAAKSTDAVRCSVSGGAAAIDSFLNVYGQEYSAAHTEIIIGVGSDPLHPGEKKLADALRAIEIIAAMPFASVTLQTRSPLILLCVPLLRALGARARVSMAIECAEDSLARTLTPALPLCSERIAAASTLCGIGIQTSIHAVPLIPRDGLAALDSFAELLRGAKCEVQISSSVNLFANAAGDCSPDDFRLNKIIHPEAHKLLYHRLLKRGAGNAESRAA